MFASELTEDKPEMIDSAHECIDFSTMSNHVLFSFPQNDSVSLRVTGELTFLS
jgi:hypothetical protein